MATLVPGTTQLLCCRNTGCPQPLLLDGPSQLASQTHAVVAQAVGRNDLRVLLQAIITLHLEFNASLHVSGELGVTLSKQQCSSALLSPSLVAICNLRWRVLEVASYDCTWVRLEAIITLHLEFNACLHIVQSWVLHCQTGHLQYACHRGQGNVASPIAAATTLHDAGLPQYA